MNNYRKKLSRKNKNKMRKTLKAIRMLKKKYKKFTLNKKFRKRYQIGCSKKNKMKGGGISALQSISDAVNHISHTGSSLINAYAGNSNPPSPDPTSHPAIDQP
jgi:hypothetical protein